MKFTYDCLWRQLAHVYDAGEAKSIVKLVLEKQFGLSSTDVYCGGTESLSEADNATLEKMLARLMDNEPVQYVLGTAEFCGRDFVVRPGVLIPRPETADLVGRIIKEMNHLHDDEPDDTHTKDGHEMNFHRRLLDIGTGSGCISVSLSLALHDVTVSAWDISESAIVIAQENARRYGADVNFCHVDALNPPDDREQWDVIVSNPPYICDKEKSEMDHHVLDFEPELALFVPDDDPLRFYRAIAGYGKKALKMGGQLYFEINPLYLSEMMQMFSELGFRDVVSMEDEYGKQRFVRCRR